MNTFNLDILLKSYIEILFFIEKSFLSILNINNLLIFILLLPLINFLFTILFSTLSTLKNNINIIYKISFILSQVTLVLSCLLIYYYNESISIFQYTFTITWDYLFNINIPFGIDGISALMILLTNFLIIICIIITWSTIKYKVTYHLACFYLLQFFLVLSFSTLDLFWFYIFFEGVLIPMFLLIGIWGSRQRKIIATYKLFSYTVFGSLLLLFSIIYIYILCGTTDIRILSLIQFPFNIEIILWILIFISFAVKTPLFPFHLWLPEAHVEASTTGSIILAGILLKLGTFGMIRYLIPMFPFASKYFSILVFIICVIGIIYISYIILIQIDLKKIIAYTSVVHMSFIVLGLFSFTYYGIQGAIILMISHGLVSGGLFLLIGSLYKRFHTRILLYYSSLVSYIPVFSIIFFIFTLFNFGFPPTGGFIGELLILSGIELINPLLLILVFSGYILSVIYSIWLFNRICFGSTINIYIMMYKDLQIEEITCLVCLIVLTILIGIFPNYIFNLCSTSIYTFNLQQCI